MAYPEPLELVSWGQRYQPTYCTLVTAGTGSQQVVDRRIARLTAGKEKLNFTISTASAFRDWLAAAIEVAQREADLSECDNCHRRLSPSQLFHRFSTSGETDQCAGCLGMDDDPAPATLRTGDEP